MKVVSTRNSEIRRGPEEWFTGVVWMDAASAGSSPDAGIFRVFFEPGARTNWHTHPEGQILYVVTGEGLAQKEGEQVVEIGPGDVVYFAPAERH
jgi:quercetin dioxygenase-like cupin family protein